MDPEQQKSSDLAGAKTTIGKTWFIERIGDGYIFACEETEAGEIIYNRTNWTRRDYKIIGVSDGTVYKKTLAESKAKSAQILGEIEALEKELTMYRKTEERMVFSDLVDPNDTDPKTLPAREKLQKLRAIIKGYTDKIEAKNTEYTRVTKTILTTAFDAELAVARGHIERPRNMNIITPGATPEERQKIISKMQG